MRSHLLSLLFAAALPACQCFNPVDELGPDASLRPDAGPDAGTDAGADAGACATACCQCDFGPPRPCPAATDPCAPVPMVAVERVAAISAPVNGLVTVTLDGGVSYLLDVRQPLGDVRRQMLESRRTYGRPAALEVDCTTNRIGAVHAPFDPSPVMRLEPTNEGLVLTLVTSAALHPVLRSRACYDQLAAALWAAKDAGASVLVTDRQPSGTEVIDVRAPF